MRSRCSRNEIGSRRGYRLGCLGLLLQTNRASGKQTCQRIPEHYHDLIRFPPYVERRHGTLSEVDHDSSARALFSHPNLTYVGLVYDGLRGDILWPRASKIDDKTVRITDDTRQVLSHLSLCIDNNPMIVSVQSHRGYHSEVVGPCRTDDHGKKQAAKPEELNLFNR
jgi:hypothetical protein